MSQAPNTVGQEQRLKIIVAQDSMSASLILRAPASEESPYQLEDVLQDVKKLGIVFGLDEEAICAALEKAELNQPVKIASGRKPGKGIDAKFTYNFDTSDKRKPSEGKDGHIDYKDINFIRNTSNDAVLATKTPPSPGEGGKTIFGKDVQGPPGRDIPFKSGANTEVSEDGLQLIATADGAILFQHGTVAVQDVMVIRGDVDFNVGNLDCRGAVRITGNVKAGFSLKVDGDIEVGGNVEGAMVNCGGNILIKGGAFGSGEGRIVADGDVTVKFAESQRIESNGNISIGGEIVNCQLVAKGNVYLKGRRGKIIGGDIKAGAEIRASVIGSDAGTTTKLTVGFDAELMKKLNEVSNEITRLEEDGSRIKEVLYGLYRLQMEGKLPSDKKQALTKLEKFQKDLPVNLEKANQQKTELEKQFAKFLDARIIAEDTIYPGVRASFGIVYRDIASEQSRCKLTCDGKMVSISEFQEE